MGAWEVVSKMDGELRSFDSRATPLLVLLVAFVLRIVNLTGESLWRDEVDSIRFALQPLDSLFASFTATGFNGPLYHLLLRGWLSLAGVSDFALRYLSLVCGVALVALVYVLGRHMFGRRTALIAAWLSAISPVLIWYAGEGKMYSLQPMLLALALYALLRANDPSFGHPLIGWAAFVLATSFSFYIHVLSPLFLPIAGLFFLALWPASRRHLAAGAIALALLTLPYLPLLVWQAPVLLRGGDIGHRFYPLDQIAWVLASNWAFGLNGQAPLLLPAVNEDTVSLVRRIAIACGLMLVAFGLVMRARRATEDAAAAGALCLQLATLGWLLLPTLMVFLISLRLPIFLPRYVLWSAPALYLLVAIGLDRLFAEGCVGRFAAKLALAAVSLVGLVGVAAQIVHPIRPDLRGAVAYVVRHAQPGDAIVFQIPYAQHSFAYYADQFGYPWDGIQAIEAPFTNHGMSPEDVARAMHDLTSSASRVWLFESEAAMWDQRGLVRRWFDEALTTLDSQSFRGVQVGLYRP